MGNCTSTHDIGVFGDHLANEWQSAYEPEIQICKPDLANAPCAVICDQSSSDVFTFESLHIVICGKPDEPDENGQQNELVLMWRFMYDTNVENDTKLATNINCQPIQSSDAHETKYWLFIFVVPLLSFVSIFF